MPIAYDHKLLFIHIPKNAGTSITSSLGMVHEGHHPIEFYKNNLPEIWKTFYKFCIVRNPLDRLVSCYEYAKMETSYHHSVSGSSRYGKHLDYDLLKEKSFDECVELLGSGILRHQGWSPQSDWVMRDGQFELDEFIKCEELGNSFRGFNLKSLNSSSRKNLEEYYTNDATLNLAKSFYSEDFKNFNYGI